MINSKFNKILIIALFSIYSKSPFAAGMNTQMDNIFTEMSNYSSPGSYETASRNVFSGGSYVMHSRIFNENLVNLQAPSLKGGCGGIDVFGGSFSFINSDQIVHLMREVASNSKGYAFQLAMDNMCPDCMKWMNELQTKMQKLNTELSNSCQLSQGIVNSTGTAAGMSNKHMTDITLTSIRNGIGDDYADLKQHIESADTSVRRLNTANQDLVENETGALTYKALNNSNIDLALIGGDEELLETMISLTGTVVIGDLVTADDGGDTLQVTHLIGGKITLKDLVEGKTNARIYDCSRSDIDDACRITMLNTKSIELVGMKTRLMTAFTGPGGVIDRLRTRDYTSQPSNAQKAVMAAMPSSISSKVFNLGPISPDAAERFIVQTSNIVALQIAKKLVDETFRVSFNALGAYEDTYISKSEKILERQKTTINDEYKALLEEYGSITKIESYYSDLMEGLNKPNYRTSN